MTTVLHGSSRLAANLTRNKSGKLKNVWRFWWQLSPAEFDFLLCAITEQKITGSGRWCGPIPPPARVTYGHACRQGDVIGCNNFSSWIFLCMHSNMLMALKYFTYIKYFTTAFILFYCSVIAATSAYSKLSHAVVTWVTKLLSSHSTGKADPGVESLTYIHTQYDALNLHSDVVWGRRRTTKKIGVVLSLACLVTRWQLLPTWF